jgi:LPS-assembly protein
MSVRNDRQSGFLFPYYLYSSNRGFVANLPFYWAINRSYDATVTAGYESLARVGGWAEFRYTPNEQTEGQLAASYFNEGLRQASPSNPPLDRWSITGSHRQELADNMRFGSDLFFVSDDLFLREISHRALSLPSTPDSISSEWNLRARRFVDSRVRGVKNWKDAFLRTEAVYYQDLVDKQDYDFQVLPRVQFKEQKFLWNNRLVASLAVEGAHFYRNKGYSGQRLDIAPSVTMPFHLGDYAFGSIGVTGRETAYHLTSQEHGPSTLTAPNLRGDRTRELAQFDADLHSRVSRVFDVNLWKLLKVKHVVEPEVSYRYVPVVNQEDLPIYDYFDRMNRRSVWVYGVTNRVLGKFRKDSVARDSTEKTEAEGSTGKTKDEDSTEKTTVRELASITLTHAYDPTRRINLEKDHYSDVNVFARFSPLSFSSFYFNTTYDVNNGSVAATRVSASISDPRSFPSLPPLLQYLQRRSSLSVSYSSTSARLIKAFNADLPHPPTNVTTAKGISTLLTLRLSESFQAAYMSRYDLNTDGFTMDRYFLRYLPPQHCWFFEIGAVDRINPHEFQFHFSFTFLGLGSTGGRPSF